MPSQTERAIESMAPTATKITTALRARELIRPRAGWWSVLAYHLRQGFELFRGAQGDEPVVG